MLNSVRGYLSFIGEFGEKEKKILEAMQKIDRKYFVPEEYAYVDRAMPIGKGQTISQPSAVARMLSLLDLKKGDQVLEIGAGSGWNACLIALLVKPGKVLSLEVHDELINNAKRNIKRFNLNNLEIKKQDFRKLRNKFDKIIFTAGVSYNKESVIEDFAKKHLNEKGILICPYRHGPLIIIKKVNDKIKKTRTKEEYVFVPLVLG